MQLSEVVEEHPSLIPVINRFGIRLGLGDKYVNSTRLTPISYSWLLILF